jgi:NADPH:quinone reductase
MKAFAVTSYKPLGYLQHLEEVRIPKPSAAGHDIVVKVKAVATNPIDYKRLGNLGNSDAKFEVDGPLVVGWDASGIVEQVGPDVTLYQPGDEVMFAGDFFRAGAFAEYVAVDSRIVGRKPTTINWSDTAALPLTFLTAWEGLTDQLKISTKKEENTGKTVLITAGGGGVGSAAIQIAKKVLGLTVIGTASRAETVAFTNSCGADHVVSHRKSFAPQLKKLGIETVDYVFHCSDLTPALFTEFVDIVKPFGGIVSIWPSASVDLMLLFWKSINFSAELMFTRPSMKTNPHQMLRQHEILNEICRLVEEGTLFSTKTMTKDMTVDNLRMLLEKQASGEAIGKMTLCFA